ncbi:hypothetical protein M407DRAFT_21101 [Tulasnella calospora MUT 4182]|uniref:Uncharacterized protein n=1 Tax=Tulasnella calospora MUT 4182 TaxID=1051891 RepID=A0A0C3QQL3_9AGAM|nr:hypothetical protein M407DRAFT_21101 [Tulasnella calospora MUT 4182]
MEYTEGLKIRCGGLTSFNKDDADSRYPIISAPRLTFCSSDSTASGIGFDGMDDPQRTLVLRKLVTALSQKCPGLEVLQVGEEGLLQPLVNEDSPEDWPALMSLTTLRFANGANHMKIRCVLKWLKALLLYHVKFQGIPVSNAYRDTDLSIPKIPVPRKKRRPNPVLKNGYVTSYNRRRGNI